MQRITITIDDELLGALDALAERRGCESRSEALREVLRAQLREDRAADGAAPCIAVLSCVYDHATRDLARRLADTMHAHHDLMISTLHVHLDHESCLEAAVLRGPVAAVRKLADSLTAQRGVRHASLHLVPAELLVERHDHGSGRQPHEHIRA
jgi:CopG family nickel-responsive transcriptional regulator